MLKSLSKSNDYLDENVNSKLILILGLISVISPLLQLCWGIYQIIDNVFMMLCFYFIGSCIIIISLWALQFGNSKPKYKYKIITSIIFALLIALYDYSIAIWNQRRQNNLSAIHINGNDTARIPVFSWMCSFSMNVSGSATLIIVILYLNLLLQKNAENIQENDDILLTKAAYKDGILNTLSMKNILNYDEMNGCWGQLREFFWPKIDERMISRLKEKKLKIYYPALLYASIFLSFLGILFLFQIMYRISNKTHQTIQMIHEFETQIQKSNLHIKIKVHIIRLFNFFSKCLSVVKHGVLYGNIIGTIFSIYAFLLTFHVHKYKMISLLFNKNGMKTQLFNESNKCVYHISNSTRYIGSMVSWLITGYFLITISSGFIIAFASSGYLFEFITSSSKWIIGTILYFILWYFVFQYLIERRFLTDNNGNIRDDRSHWFNIFLLLNNFTFLPLGILFGLYRILFWLIFLLFSFLRPDISMYPYNLRDWDVAHLNYYSFLRLIFLRMEYNPILSNIHHKNSSNTEIQNVMI